MCDKYEWQSLSNKQFGYYCSILNQISDEKIDYFKEFANLAKKLKKKKKEKTLNHHQQQKNPPRKLVEEKVSTLSHFNNQYLNGPWSPLQKKT